MKSEEYNGQIIKLMPLSSCLKFASVSDAIAFCSMMLKDFNSPNNDRVSFNVGAHICEEQLDRESNEFSYGDGLGFAARLLAESQKTDTNSIFISSSVYEIIKTIPLKITCEFVKDWYLKHNDLTIKIYRVIL